MFVIGSAGGSEKVPGDAQLLPTFHEKPVEMLGYLGGRLAFLLSPDSYRRAVDIGAGNHEHLVAPGAVIPGEDISREVCPRDVTQMQAGIGVRPGNPDVD